MKSIIFCCLSIVVFFVGCSKEISNKELLINKKKISVEAYTDDLISLLGSRQIPENICKDSVSYEVQMLVVLESGQITIRVYDELFYVLGRVTGRGVGTSKCGSRARYLKAKKISESLREKYSKLFIKEAYRVLEGAELLKKIALKEKDGYFIVPVNFTDKNTTLDIIYHKMTIPDKENKVQLKLSSEMKQDIQRFVADSLKFPSNEKCKEVLYEANYRCEVGEYDNYSFEVVDGWLVKDYSGVSVKSGKRPWVRYKKSPFSIFETKEVKCAFGAKITDLFYKSKMVERIFKGKKNCYVLIPIKFYPTNGMR